MLKPLTNIVVWGVCIVACIFVSIVVLAGDENGLLNIVQSRGVDQRVDYNSLTKFGPWDDRNYALTTEDLEFLSSDEYKLNNQLPAFFRVELRKEMPHLRKSGPAQYPRSALQLFYLRYGGLKQNGEIGDGGPASKSGKPCGARRETGHK